MADGSVAMDHDSPEVPVDDDHAHGSVALGHDHDAHDDHGPADDAWVLLPIVVGLVIGLILALVFGLASGVSPLN